MKAKKNKGVTRRDFIKKTGVVGAGLGAVAAVPSFAGIFFGLLVRLSDFWNLDLAQRKPLMV